MRRTGIYPTGQIMAISYTHFDILRTLHSRGVLPQGGAILEIGEANWYGDFDVEEVFKLAGDECDPEDTFAVADLIYKSLFAYNSIQAIDAGGPTAVKADLNNHIAFDGEFDVTYNHGTAEHVFNIAQVFRTMHEACKVGGIMIHEGPFTGWVDHGFYCLQPTLFWDLATANGYKVEFAAVEHLASRTWEEIHSRESILEVRRRGQLSDNLMLYVVLRKQVDQPFSVPMQGVYAGTVSDGATRAWKELR